MEGNELRMKINMRATVFVTFLAMIGLVVSLVVRLGGFKTVVIAEAEAGPWKTVSKHHLGAYYKIAPVIDEVEKYVRSHGRPCTLTFGQFLDDVDRVPEDRLNSNGGCIVEEALDTLPEGYVNGAIGKRRFVVGEFAGAPSIGPLKVYPRARRYMTQHLLTLDGPVIEMYQVMDDKSVITRYYFPIRSQ